MKILLLAAIFFLGGCATLKKQEQTNFSPLSLEEFLADQKNREQTLSKTEGKLEIRYSLNRNSFSGPARIIKTAQQSRFEVRDPMGRTRYWMIGDSKGVLAAYETDRVAYVSDDSGNSYFQQFFGLNLSWQEIQNLWVGILPKNWRQNLSAWNQKAGFYEAIIPLASGQIFLEVSGHKRQVSRVLFKQGQKNIEIHFSDFDACCAQGGTESVLGHGVEIKLPDSDEKIELEWEELNILDQIPNPEGFKRKIPNGFRVIRLDKERRQHE